MLIGYRGSGKSTVGEALAERLGRPFIDTDADVRARFGGRDAAEVFADPSLGEKGFREVEAAAVAEAMAGAAAGAVVATGGGAVTESAAGRAAVTACPALCVYLHAEAAVLAARISADPHNRRPGLSAADADPAAEVAELLKRREPIYRAVADETVGVADLTPAEAVDAVVALLPR